MVGKVGGQCGEGFPCFMKVFGVYEVLSHTGFEVVLGAVDIHISSEVAMHLIHTEGVAAYIVLAAFCGDCSYIEGYPSPRRGLGELVC